MLLGSLAWKIGCAFKSGSKGAPSEFHEVENELQSLQASFSALADALGEDGSILSRADDRTQEGLRRIVSSCSEVSVHPMAIARPSELMRVTDFEEFRGPCQPISRATEERWDPSSRWSPSLENNRDSQLQEAIMDLRRREHSGSSEHVATACGFNQYHGDSTSKVRSCDLDVERKMIT